ncbi:SusC/RagA family TonB-linked outer membrane protein [Bacteroidota bacterium]
MNRKLSLIAILLLFIIPVLRGQDQRVTGRVSGEDGVALPGANVLVQGTTRGVITDPQGDFTIQVQASDVLSFSFVGYESQVITVGNQTEINVSMVLAATDLEEIVVIGYGTQKRSHFTGAVAGISADKEKLNQIPVSRLDHALQGKLAGVQIRDKTSQVGEAPDIKIRGSASFNASNQPLIVIDGFPMVGGDLSDVDMTDVQSLEVLKDAASTAIYGSRGANGVIMITTKKGKSEKAVFNLKVSTGFSQVYEYFDAYDGDGLAQYYFNEEKQKWETPYLRLGEAVPGNGIDSDGNPILNPDGDPYPVWEEWYSPTGKGDFYYQHNILSDISGSTNWQEGITQSGWNQNVTMSATGGNENVQYYISGAYRDDKGVLVDNEYSTFSFNSNLDVKLSDRISIGVSIRPQYQKRRNSHAAMANAIKQIELPLYHDEYSLSIGIGPTIGWKNVGDYAQAADFQTMYATDADGNLLTNDTGNPIFIKTEFSTAAITPLSESLTDHDWTTFYKLTGNAYLKWKLADGLVFRTTFGTNVRYSERNRYTESYNVSKGQNNAGNGRGTLWNTLNYSLVNENTLKYQKQLGSHNIDLLGGFSVENYVNTNSRIQGNLFPNDYVRSLNQAGEITKEDTYSGKSDEGLLSGFARVQYNYMDKYLLSAVMRADGSSQFGPNKRVGYFPSVSAGWRLSEEGFMQSADWLSNLKLRATWGISGNNRIDRYSYVTPISMRQYEMGSAILSGFAPVPQELGAPRVLGNPDLGWEQTNEINIGLDFGLFRNRIAFSVDAYTNHTTSLLLQDPVVTITGFESQWANIGEIRNKGIEMMMNTVNIVKSNFSWNMGVNVTVNRNHLVSYGDLEEQFFTGYKHQYVLRVNEPVCQYYGYVTDGIWKTTQELIDAQNAGLAQSSDVVGGVKIIDYNKDGVVNSEDQTTIGNPYSDFDWGFLNKFVYKKFDLSVNFQGSHGFDVMQQSFWYGQKTGKYYLDDLYVDEFHGYKPIKTGSIIESDYYVEDGSYLALRDFILGYNHASKKVISNMRIYFSVHNLFYWWYKDYHGINPEYVRSNPVDGVSGTILYGEQIQTKPLARTFQFGIDISF